VTVGMDSLRFCCRPNLGQRMCLQVFVNGIVEFCHAWIKSKLGLRQFHVRGLRKVQMEMLWACLTYNLQHWICLKQKVRGCSKDKSVVSSQL
jgi:hypothetical protein